MKLTRTLMAAALVAGSLVVISPDQAAAQQQDVRQASVGNLISALNNINAQVRALENVNVENVRVVTVKDVLNDNNVQAFNNALNRNNVEILNLRNVLNDNEIIKNSLNENNIAIGQVVAVDVLSGGDVVIFYQEQA